jgi:nucleoside-diphosphate-sugar epimerase
MNVFLTGATGLIGGEILRALVASGHTVHALVRAPDDVSARRRLRGRLAMSGGTLTPEVVPVRGDVTSSDCGLSPRDASRLMDAADLVLHCAAVTRFDDPEACRAVNVEGTRHVLALASHFRRLRRFLHVSSASVVSGPPSTEIAESRTHLGPTNAYVDSKREAEGLLSGSGLRTVTLRPSIVLSGGVSSATFARSILWVVPAAHTMGVLPVSGEERIDLVPVRWVGECVARIVEREKALALPVYHVSAGAAGATRVRDVLDVWRDLAGGAAGLPDQVSVEEWRARNSGQRRGRRLVAACEYYLPFIAADVVYDPSRLAALLGSDLPPLPRFAEYGPEILATITLRQALREASRP